MENGERNVSSVAAFTLILENPKKYHRFIHVLFTVRFPLSPLPTPPFCFYLDFGSACWEERLVYKGLLRVWKMPLLLLIHIDSDLIPFPKSSSWSIDCKLWKETICGGSQPLPLILLVVVLDWRRSATGVHWGAPKGLHASVPQELLLVLMNHIEKVPIVCQSSSGGENG